MVIYPNWRRFGEKFPAASWPPRRFVCRFVYRSPQVALHKSFFTGHPSQEIHDKHTRDKYTRDK